MPAPSHGAADVALTARRLSQRATEEALREVIAKVAADPRNLAAILDAYPQPLIAFAADRTVLVANAALETFFGYGRHELDGTLTDVLVPERLRQPDAPPMVATDVLTTVELPGRQRDGGELSVSWTFGAATTADGPIFVLVIRDRIAVDEALEALHASEERYRILVTENRAERAAREVVEASHEQLRRLHEAAVALSAATTVEQVVAVVLDRCLPQMHAKAGALFTFDEAGSSLELLGYRGVPAEAIARYAHLPLSTPFAGTEAVRTRTPVFFDSREDYLARFPQQAEALRGVTFQSTVSLPLIARHAVVGLLTFWLDEVRPLDDAQRSLLLTMTELCAQALDRAQLFAAEQRARADAEAASLAKDEFLAMLGHELRNPLAPIATAVQLMKLRGDGEVGRERAVIERQVEHIRRLVDDLLDVSRVTRGKLELARAATDMADVIARAVEMASPLFEQRGHAIKISSAPGLIVNGDAARLAQVLANVLTNAAKYTPKGTGRIELVAERDRDEAVIRVRDNGEGIAPDLLPDVFDLFVQGRRTFDRAQGGLGIGLALVKNLVTLHGGTVTAASEGLGKGSEFVIRLPIGDPASAPARAAEPATVVPGARKRVLVVDDNRDSAELMSAALDALGYEVVFELDGISALERLRTFDADAAVLDLGLPVLDGFELARRIRSEVTGPRPRLIALTGYGQARDRERSASAGFSAHLVKPVDIAAVVAELERT